jgi:hypothetical protein
MRMLITVIGFCFTVFASFVTGCSADIKPETSQAAHSSSMSMYVDRDAHHRAVVDCLLPGQLRSLGQSTYLSPKRAVKVSAAECELRGGEYANSGSVASQRTLKSKTDNRIDEEQLYGGMF